MWIKVAGYRWEEVWIFGVCEALGNECLDNEDDDDEWWSYELS